MIELNTGLDENIKNRKRGVIAVVEGYENYIEKPLKIIFLGKLLPEVFGINTYIPNLADEIFHLEVPEQFYYNRHGNEIKIKKNEKENKRFCKIEYILEENFYYPIKSTAFSIYETEGKNILLFGYNLYINNQFDDVYIDIDFQDFINKKNTPINQGKMGQAEIYH